MEIILPDGHKFLLTEVAGGSYFLPLHFAGPNLKFFKIGTLVDTGCDFAISFPESMLSELDINENSQIIDSVMSETAAGNVRENIVLINLKIPIALEQSKITSFIHII